MVIVVVDEFYSNNFTQSQMCEDTLVYLENYILHSYRIFLAIKFKIFKTQLQDVKKYTRTFIAATDSANNFNKKDCCGISPKELLKPSRKSWTFISIPFLMNQI